MRDWSSFKQHLSPRKSNKFSLIVFFFTLSTTTALMFHALAYTKFDPNDPVRDKDLPIWCPQPDNPGLAAICGTVLSSTVQEAYQGIEQPAVALNNIMIGAYEENLVSPTGKISGGLTNLFSSTVTNGEGRYRILVRRVKAPRLKIHLVFFCAGSKSQELVVDSWHNTWNLSTYLDCPVKQGKSTALKETGLTADTTPPVPLEQTASFASFLGCTNEYRGDTAIGLAKREQPVINTPITEENYDHRFNLNKTVINSEMAAYFGGTGFTFNSPGGLWEPDCLLRNEDGVYMCNTLKCSDWTVGNYYGAGVQGGYIRNQVQQPCTGENATSCGITRGYTGMKLYTLSKCEANPNGLNADGSMTETEAAIVDACKQENAKKLADFMAANDERLPEDPIDGVLCNSTDEGMGKADYITRPFFKYIPKGPVEYEAPFRRFEYRNNLQNFASDPFIPMQWINTYVGSAANSGSGIPIATFRAFTGEVSTKPDVPACGALYQRNLPYQSANTPVTQNRLINTGFMTALAEPHGTYEETYYSGQKDLSLPVCEMENTGQLIRLCDIQVPWGAGALCDISKPGCKDPDLRSRLRQSLNRLNAPTTLLDGDAIGQYTANINNTLNSCGGNFKLSKIHFPSDLIFRAGNTQMGLHSDTPNDSIAAYAERRTNFEPTGTEQDAEAQTGSRVALQGGGKFMANSFNTVLCAINPQVCNNNKRAENLESVLLEPYADSYEQMKKRYLDETTWKVDSYGPGQSSMCSISNNYNIDIRGPIEEIKGYPGYQNPDVKAQLQGGNFDQLFKSNGQHKNQWSAGTASWYMSNNAVVRDRTTMTGAAYIPLFLLKPVGTDSAIAEIAFAAFLGRDIWDSLLTIGGGDGNLHDMYFHLPDIGDAILGSIAGETPWKSYAHRKQGNGIVTPAEKPYYTVTFEYPLTETSFKDKFRLPGLTENEDGTSTYVEPDVRPEEWGPGHECYNFDSPVPQGQICGTYREAPEGLSRTCRPDKCVAFTRVQTAVCKCTRKVVGLAGDRPIYADPGDEDNVECGLTKREDRNLIIRDCTRSNRLKCGNLQETSDPWDQVPNGYMKTRTPTKNDRALGGGTLSCNGPNQDTDCTITTPYFQDKRTGSESTGRVLPPNDIDQTIEANDQLDHYQGYQDPPQIPDTPETCNPDMFDWEPDKGSKEKTIVGPESNTRPRCWATVAGPFRKYPNFTLAGVETPELERAETGQQLKTCNGYLEIPDSAVRASQSAPYESEGQKQHTLDKSTIIGIQTLKTFSSPYQPTWGGSRYGVIDSRQTNNGLVNAEGLAEDTFTRGQAVNLGGVGDVSTLRTFFVPPNLVPLYGQDTKLKPMAFHCDYEGSHTITNKDNKQFEKFNPQNEYDPDLDGIGGWKCPIVPPPDPQVPDIENKIGGGCNVTQFGKCTQMIRSVWTNTVQARTDMKEEDKLALLKKIATFEFATTFKNQINWAAYQSNTPGGALMTAMFLEGGLDLQYIDILSDNYGMHNAGVPWWGQMDWGGPASCNDLVWTAQGPYQSIKHWVECLVDPESLNCSATNAEVSARFCSAMNKAGQGRCEKILNAGRCNFLDASVIAAFFMNPKAGMSPGQCSDFNLDAALSLYSGGSYQLEGGQNLMDTAATVYAACK